MAGSHLGSQASSHRNISLLEISSKLSTGRLVSLQISWKRDQLSAHKDHQSHSRDFVRRRFASQAANCAETKWLPAKVEKVMEQDLYTIDQACAQLAISRATLYRLIEEKQIARIKIGKSARISRQALDRFVSARTQAVYDAWE